MLSFLDEYASSHVRTIQRGVRTFVARSFDWWLMVGAGLLREKYCWLVAGGWFVVREKYCWLVADKPSEQGVDLIRKSRGGHSVLTDNSVRFFGG
jgi:hypothetical protein